MSDIERNVQYSFHLYSNDFYCAIVNLVTMWSSSDYVKFNRQVLLSMSMMIIEQCITDNV